MTGPTRATLPAAMMSVVSCARSRTGTGIAPRSCEHDDGSLRVRKSSRGDAPPGPWGLAALRKEIAYLSTLPPRARAVFPPLLAAWDDAAADPPRVGYEVPFYADHLDAGALARERALAQRGDRSVSRRAGGDGARTGARVGACGRPSRSRHTSFPSWITRSARWRRIRHLAPLVRAESIRLNGEPQAGPRAAFARAIADGALLAALDAAPQVRLHGDLLPREHAVATTRRDAAPAVGPQLLLIDPVSVAGVASGPPLFDLVKYESYATGELPALRSDWVDVGGFDGGDDYPYRVRWQSAELAAVPRPRLAHALSARVRSQVRPRRRRAYRLIDGYFSVAMAVNTGGIQRRARLLKATQDFNAAASLGVIP